VKQERDKLKTEVLRSENWPVSKDTLIELVKQERHKLKTETLRSENWPVSKDTLINKYNKFFKKICGQHNTWKITEYIE
jgi:hypothetical protein